MGTALKREMKAGTIARGVAATMMAGAAVFALVCVITPHNVQLEALKGVPEMLSSAASAASSTSSSSSSSAAKKPPTPVGGFVAVKKGKCLTPIDATQLKVDGVFGHHTTQDLQILINKNLPAQEPKKLPTEGIWCKETKRGLQVYIAAGRWCIRPDHLHGHAKLAQHPGRLASSGSRRELFGQNLVADAAVHQCAVLREPEERHSEPRHHVLR